MEKRRIVVTSALPYANNDIHLGNLFEHLITDFWARFQKMRGHECVTICADDTHGTPIMIEAKKRGRSPEELVRHMFDRHVGDLKDFHIAYDHYGSTHTEKNRSISNEIYRQAREKDLVATKTIEQLYCTHDKMFLPDRFVKGTCPKCNATDQYGDSCDRCGAVYEPKDMLDAACVLCGNRPEPRKSDHCFFRLGTQTEFLKQWIQGRTSNAVAKKLAEWLDDGLQDWCFTRDEPYFGFELPDHKGKYYYVWFDAPIGYVSSTWQWCEQNDRSLDEFWRSDRSEIYHNIGKDIVYFHSLFWPAMLHNAGFTTPKGIWVHGMVTVNGEKMSKSRGTFIKVRTYLDHLPPEYLRYYFACKANDSMTDIDLNLEDFASRVNADLIGKITNVASRGAQMLGKQLQGKMSELDSTGKELVGKAQNKQELIASLYENRQFSKAMLEIREIADWANQYFDQHTPWQLIKEDKEATRTILTNILHLFRIMAIYLKPIIPTYADAAAALFNEDSYQWNDLNKTLEGCSIQPYQHLIKRLDNKKLKALVEASKETTGESDTKAKAATAKTEHDPLEAEITVDDFFKVDLRVAKIIQASHVEGAAKLLRLEIDLGHLGQRQIFAGIKSAYQPEDLQGRLIVVVANLKPRKMKFGLSEGMTIAASAKGDKGIWLLSPDSGAKPGMRVG